MLRIVLRLGGTVAAAAAIALGSACANDRADRHLPVEDGHRVVRVLYAGASERIFSPTWDDTPKFLIFQPLVTYAASTCSDIVGGLAERWEASEDGKIWTVALRPDIRWHDGVPVTADDVAFSVNLWRHPDVLSYEAGSVDSVEVLDALRFRVHLRAPGMWPTDGWSVVYPKHLLEDLDPAGFYDWEFWSRPVGNGPFRYVRHVPETMVELEPNPDYYLGAPAVDRVRIQFKAGGQGQTGITELLAGNVDVVPITPLEVRLIEHDERFATYYRYQASSIWLLWNFTDPRFEDVRVRRALAHGTDRRALQRVLRLPEGVPVTDGIFFMCDPTDIRVPAPYAYDPERARALLGDAGWTDTDGDGVLDRNGEPFRFTLILYEDATTAAIFVQDQLRQVGIDMRLRVLDGSVVRNHFTRGDFEAIIVQRTRVERVLVERESPLGAPDLELVRGLEALAVEPDLDQLLALWRDVGERYRDLAPAMFLHATMSVMAADRRLAGLGRPGTIAQRMAWRHAFGGLEYVTIDE